MAGNAIGNFQNYSAPRITIAFGTAFTALIPGRKGLKAKIITFSYTSGGTAHTLTFMKPLSRVTLSASVAKGATTMILTSDPGAWGSAKTVAANPIAANDWIAYKKDDDTWEWNKPSVVTVNSDGTVTMTITATGAAVTKSSERFVYFFGLPADTDPNTGLAHPVFSPPVSATTNYVDTGAPYVVTTFGGDPILIHSNNITATGVLEYADALYAP